MAEPPRILLTGEPGVGKTTLVRAVLARLPGVRASGFTTEEKRGEGGARVGFRVVALDGAAGGLATVGAVGAHKVGRYTVHLATFEAVALPSLAFRGDVRLWVVDEIGKMECLSPRFVDAARRILGGAAPVLATVAASGGGFVASAKALAGVEVIEVTRANRDALVEALAARLRDAVL